MTGFCCDVCGRRRKALPTICAYCHSAICDRCWNSQGGHGHEYAEHRHEMAQELGDYKRGDEDYGYEN